MPHDKAVAVEQIRPSLTGRGLTRSPKDSMQPSVKNLGDSVMDRVRLLFFVVCRKEPLTGRQACCSALRLSSARRVPGVVPVVRLNARLKAASEP